MVAIWVAVGAYFPKYLAGGDVKPIHSACKIRKIESSGIAVLVGVKRYGAPNFSIHFEVPQDATTIQIEGINFAIMASCENDITSYGRL